jgi:hypothetical protein
MSIVAEVAAHACDAEPAVSTPPENRVKPRILSHPTMLVPSRRQAKAGGEFAGQPSRNHPLLQHDSNVNDSTVKLLPFDGLNGLESTSSGTFGLLTLAIVAEWTRLRKYQAAGPRCAAKICPVRCTG